MKIEIIAERRLKPPRYVPMLGWVQEEFYAISQCKKDGVLIKNPVGIDADIQAVGNVEAVYGSERKHPTTTNTLTLSINGETEEFNIISFNTTYLPENKLRLDFEVEKN